MSKKYCTSVIRLPLKRIKKPTFLSFNHFAEENVDMNFAIQNIVLPATENASLNIVKFSIRKKGEKDEQGIT